MEDTAELLALVAAVVESDGAAAASCYDRYKSILTKYQEQPQLLDGYLEGIVQPLATLLRHTALSSTAQDTASVRDICRLLHVLITVRGYKTVVRFFPHEAADLERVLQVLGFVANAPAAADSSSSDSSIAFWEAQAVLLLWLSILVLIPFDLVILDSEVTCGSSRAAAQVAYPPLAAKIMNLCKAYLQHPGAVREMAALLLARLLTRPDMAVALADFMQWQQQALGAAAGPAAVFLLPGVMQTLALIFKIGRREQLLPLAPQLWQQVSALFGDDNSGLASNALARKLAVKLTQRIGLVLLPPQLAGWRYVKAAGDLGRNLAAAGAANACSPQGTDTAPAPCSEAAAAAPAAADSDAAAPEIPEEIEDLLGVLLSSCCDRDTVVRWSAAKGVGRLAGCLPRDLAEEVVEGTLGLLSPTEQDMSWHGGCLAIADLARRSILSPERLPAVTALLQQALAYDVRRGPCSVGGHVRDAAAYVCWALARAYEPQQLSNCVSALAASLLIMACYDREVNCRRAAASAFQECVGRLGSFPHGLDILAVADYYSVGNVASAYLRVAPFVASFSEYTQALLEHLVAVKLRHWDKALRSLAAMGLAALAPVAARQLASQALPQLLGLVTSDVLEVRTGAVLGVAELLPALAAAGISSSGTAAAAAAAGQPMCDGGSSSRYYALERSTAAGVAGVLGQLEAAGMYRGKGGELMREAAARLVEQTAAAVSGSDVVPLLAFGPSKRHQSEQALQHQGQGSRDQEQQPRAAADGEEEDVMSDQDDTGTAPETGLDGSAQVAISGGNGGSHKEQRGVLQLLLTAEYHAAAVRLMMDCLGHAQLGIQASGAAALKAYARAFESSDEQRPQLLALVDQLCARIADRDALPPARRGAAAGLGLLPAGLVAHQAGRVLGVLAAAAQIPGDSQAGLDVEARIAAVSSLAQLTLELLQAVHPAAAGNPAALAAGPRESSVAAAVPIELLTDTVCPALLAALEDYTRDNRGDVGSWVREAAMDGLAQLVLALGNIRQQQRPQNHQQQQQQLDHTAAVLSQGVASLQLHHKQDKQQQQQQHAVDASAAAAGELEAAGLAQLHSRLSQLVVSGLLKQSLERIARLREVANVQLRSLLAQPATAAVVPGAATIAAALPEDAVELAGVASLAGVAKLGGLLHLPWYRMPLLEGLVASVGGVDASLAKAASAALLAQLEDAPAVQGDGDSAAAAAAARAAQRSLGEDVAQLLVQLWQKSTGSVRLSLPLIKTAALLITHAGFAGVPVPSSDSTAAADILSTAADSHSKQQAIAAAAAAAAEQKGYSSTAESNGTSSSFAWGVLQLLKQELRACADVPKLLEGAALMAQLACIPDCSASAIQSVMVLLVNRFPKVRRHMAEQLYLQMLAVQAESMGNSCTEQLHAGQYSIFAAVPADDLESALDALLISPWDGPLEQARAGREELAGHLHIEIKTRKVARPSERRACPGEGPCTEHESYQSLLDDAARGGGY